MIDFNIRYIFCQYVLDKILKKTQNGTRQEIQIINSNLKGPLIYMSHNSSFQDITTMQEDNQIIKTDQVQNSSSFCQVITDLQELQKEKKNTKSSLQKQEKQDTNLLNLDSYELKDEQIPINPQNNLNIQTQQLLLREDNHQMQTIDLINKSKLVEEKNDQMKELDCVESKLIYSEFDEIPVGNRSYLNKGNNAFVLPCYRKQVQKIMDQRRQIEAIVSQPQELIKEDIKEDVKEEQTQSKRQQQVIIKIQKKPEQRKQYTIACQRKQFQAIQKQAAKNKKNNQNRRNTKSAQRKQQSSIEESGKKDQNQKFEQFMKKCQLQSFRCLGGNKANKVCGTNSCRSSAFICNKEQCSECPENHKSCYMKFDVKMFSQMLKHNLRRQKNIERQVFEFQESVLEKIQENRLKTIKYLAFQGLNSKWEEQMREVTKSLSLQLDLNGSEVIECFAKFQKEEKYDNQRLSFIKSRLGQFKEQIFQLCQRSNRMLLQSFTNSLLTTLSSKLVSKKSSIKFILNNLDYPQQLKLLYRASENEFKLSKYHQLCNNIENTLTIIKTEHNKLVGAYTPLQLNDRVGFDRKNKTFLMAIDLQQKMEQIHRGECAIYYSEELGPCFGGLFDQRDVEVYSQNGNLYCETNFPSAFNWKNYFKSCQESWHFLTGVNTGNKCRIIDFEVFKVEFRK